MSSITRLAFKEAFDSIPEGIVFSQNSGRIVLINKVMINLSKSIMTGKITNAQRFWSNLLHNQNNEQIKKVIFGEQIIVRMPDGMAWVFTRDSIKVGEKTFVQIIAADITKADMIIRQLESNIQSIIKKREGLLYMLDNMESIKCEKELNIIKYRVHDVLGYHLSVINQLLSSEEEISFALNKLEKFVDNWPKEIREEDLTEPEEILDSLINSFARIGVSITVTGKLPNNKQTKLMLYKVIKEAAINAVCHARATNVDVIVSNQEGYLSVVIKDNGEATSGNIVEGGGIGSMRYWLREAGGSISITTDDDFCINVNLPV